MRRFGLIGKTLKHSFSQQYFSEKFAREKISNCSYQNFELSSVGLVLKIIEETPGLEGLNITIPYKEVILPFLHKKDKVVSAIGACNCIKIKNNQLSGFNTDSQAFKLSLQKLLKPHHQKAIILGTGGASKAVQYALAETGVEFKIVSRNKQNGVIIYQDLNEDVLNEYQIIINATPIGTHPRVDEAVPIPYNFLGRQHFLFDLVYNPSKTLFLKRGEEKGSQISNGYEMLVLQAQESWRIWNDLEV